MYSTWRLCTPHNVWLNLNIKIGEHQKLYAYIIKHQNHLSIQFSLWFFIFFFLLIIFYDCFNHFTIMTCVEVQAKKENEIASIQKYQIELIIVIDKISHFCKISLWIGFIGWIRVHGIKRIEEQQKKM